MKWVHIVEMRLEGAELSPNTLATAVLDEGADTVRIDGDSPVAEDLRTHGVLSLARGKSLSVADGKEFLEALSERFRTAYQFATGVQEGPAVVPYRLSPMQKAA